MLRVISIFLAIIVGGTCMAQTRADKALGLLDKYVDDLGAYKITFDLTSADFQSEGLCAVNGDSYYIKVGESEIYADGLNRYEVDGSRKEINIDILYTHSRNILDNPTHCFDFIGEEYSAEIVGERDGCMEIHLSGNDIIEEGDIYITIETSTGRPLSILYTLYEDEVLVKITDMRSDSTPVKKFAKAEYRGFEIIDFR